MECSALNGTAISTSHAKLREHLRRRGGNNVSMWKSTVKCLLDMTWPLHTNAPQLRMPAQTCTRSSQQRESAFQQMVLTGLHGLQWVWGADMDIEWGKMTGTA